MNQKYGYRTVLGVLTMMLLITSGCKFLGLGKKNKDLFEPHRVEKQADAGSAQVSVQFVAPWDAYVDDLQAKFPMTEAQALSSVVPTTLLLNEMLLDATRASARLALPQTGVTRSTVQTDTGATFTRTESLAPGDVSAITFDSLGLGGRTAAGLPGRSALGGALGIDPMLQHLAALALFQEVKLLNRYVEDAALRYDFVPFVVRLQVSVMPNARKEPYDVYSTFSFLTPLENEQVDYYADEADTLVKIQNFYASQTDTLATSRRDSADEGLEELQGRFSMPFVLPLLVTDNLEAALQSRSIDQIRQLAFGINLLYQGFGAAADFQQFSEQFQSVFGRDMNSLLTVARVSDNTLKVRLGAQFMTQSLYTMVPRTHNVTLVLLVPRAYIDWYREWDDLPLIRLVAKTTMVDADTGEELRPLTHDEQRHKYHDVFNTFLELSEIPDKAELNRYGALGRVLLDYVQTNDYVKYLSCLNELRGMKAFKTYNRSSKAIVPLTDCKTRLEETPNVKPDTTKMKRLWNYKESVWTGLVTVMDKAQYQGASFQLPPTADPYLPNTLQAILIQDDGEKQATVTLRDGQELVPARMSATLDIRGYPFATENIQVIDGGKEVYLTFPSPAKWGLKIDPDSCSKDVKLNVTLARNPWLRSSPILTRKDTTILTRKYTTCRYLKLTPKKQAQDPGFTMAVTAGSVVINPKTDQGSLRVYVEFKKEETKPDGTIVPAAQSVVLDVLGPGLVNVRGGDREGKTIKVTRTVKKTETGIKTVVLELDNLHPGDQIILSAKNGKGVKHSSITLPIKSAEK